MFKFLIAFVMMVPAVAQAAPFHEVDATYPWKSTRGGPHTYGNSPIRTQIPPPKGFSRVQTDTWGEWLRDLPVEEAAYAVHNIDGEMKENQSSHHRVVSMNVLPYQQCADSILRLRAEFEVSRGQTFRFSGMSFSKGSREAFDRFLGRLFIHKGTHNLAGELARVSEKRVMPGDVLVRGGNPGHAILVVDVVQDRHGNRKLLLANGFMPAQEFHVLELRGSPWFNERDLDFGLVNPLWRPFTWSDLRRF